MGRQMSFHAPSGAADFLGWRKRQGTTEIVYDDGVARRMIWRVSNPEMADAGLEDALRIAVSQNRILQALYAELKKRAIAVEKVMG